MRRRRNTGVILFTLVVLLLLALPVWQLFDWAKTKESQENSVRLLYQVSSFEMELLESAMKENNQPKTAGQLEAWKRAAYAAAYVHERFVQGTGSEGMPKLDSLSALQMWITRVQVGGDRPLRQEEQELAKETVKRLQTISELYGGLMESGDISAAKRDAIQKADQELLALIKKSSG